MRPKNGTAAETAMIKRMAFFGSASRLSAPNHFGRASFCARQYMRRLVATYAPKMPVSCPASIAAPVRAVPAPPKSLRVATKTPSESGPLRLGLTRM